MIVYDWSYFPLVFDIIFFSVLLMLQMQNTGAGHSHELQDVNLFH